MSRAMPVAIHAQPAGFSHPQVTGLDSWLRVLDTTLSDMAPSQIRKDAAAWHK